MHRWTWHPGRQLTSSQVWAGQAECSDFCNELFCRWKCGNNGLIYKMLKLCCYVIRSTRHPSGSQWSLGWEVSPGCWLPVEKIRIDKHSARAAHTLTSMGWPGGMQWLLQWIFCTDETVDNELIYTIIKLYCYVICSTRHPEGSQWSPGWLQVIPGCWLPIENIHK